MQRPSCKGLSLFLLVLILFVITIHSKKKPPKAKARGRAAAVLNQDSECGHETDERCHEVGQTQSVQDCGPNEAYFNQTERCHETGTRGACLEMMTFYADSEAEVFGDCDCDESDCSQNLFYAYWPLEGRCYPAFERGPCSENEWLIQGASGNGECQLNPCAVDHGNRKESGHMSSEANAGGEANQTDLPRYSMPATVCGCIRMEKSDTEHSDLEKSESETTPSSGGRVFKSDLTCTCKEHRVQLANSTSAAINLRVCQSFLSWSALVALKILIPTRE